MVEEIDLSGVTYYSDNVYGSPVYVSDGNLATYCQQMSYIAIDFGSGNSETISQIKIAVHNTTAQTAITGATPYFQGSNDTTNGVDGNWTNLVQITSVNFGTPDSYPGFGDVIEFVNTTAYRWHKLAGTTRSPSTVVNEWIFYGEPPWDGKIDTPEMITTTSTVSDIQLQLDSPESLVTTSADSSLFVGVPIVTPEIIVTTGGESDLQLNIDSAESVVTTGADSDIQLQLDSPEALVTTASLSGIYTGVLIITPEMIVTTFAESDLQLQLDTPDTLVTTSGESDIQLQLDSPEIIVTTGASSLINFFETGDAKVRFFLNITGSADGLDDVEIPISSFQARKRSDANTYLSAVIPNIDYIDTLTDRSNGTMQIKQGYEKNGVILQKDIIIEAEMETPAYDQGGTNQSITVSGYKDQTFTAKAVLLTNATYKSLRNGKLRFRFAEPNIYLNPGDTVTVGLDTLIVDTLSYAISAESVNNFEISEA